jgi:hypothetical protein
VKDMMEPSFPPAELKQVAILDMNGTRDEAIPPQTVDAHRESHGALRAQVPRRAPRGLHHYLFTQESIKVVGTFGCASSIRVFD